MEQLITGCYGGITRGNEQYPVSLVPWPGGELEVEIQASIDIDPALADLGEQHLQGRLAANPSISNGSIWCWVASSANTIRIAQGRYFDFLRSADALFAERRKWGLSNDAPLLRRVHEVVVDPLTSGSGRAAALGLSVVVLCPSSIGDGIDILLGRRSVRVGTDPDMVHVLPSGIASPADPGPPIWGTLQAEFAEELGLCLSVDDLRSRASILGVAMDLVRLRPELAFSLRLTAEETALIRTSSEFISIIRVPFTAEGMRAFWAYSNERNLALAAVGPLALVEFLLNDE